MILLDALTVLAAVGAPRRRAAGTGTHDATGASGDGGDGGDDALIARHRDGDRAAFAAIYDRHVDAVYARLTRLLGPISEREDLTQDVFLGLHRALPTFRGDAALGTLLYRITVNVAFEHLRRRARRPTVALDEVMLAALVDPGPTPEATTRRGQDIALVLRCLDRIKPAKRIALVLRAVEGLSIDEIARVVQASPDAAAKRVQHGLKELTALLAREEARR
ncbi:MAG: RNA polymerase sigma factor [Kofleriaceae bacterium]|nr:RNA polymerase sigma factor [Kofleriaceae bacterium]